MQTLTLFYDGTCPLCKKEMAALRKHDIYKRIDTVDIFSEDFHDYPQIDPKKANTILHAIDESGRLWLGLDAVYHAWNLVGKGWMYAPSRWRLIKPTADKLYYYFARNRYQISLWLTGKSRCSNGSCSR
ncbi:DUF393 domain-containing protein [Vibrio sp. ZSDZ65]|uniref:DUF393 domain-containing protein n=1 Tax=Vibrio qingdaonensis TaxID=2829491 RepID=A0A9X3CP42_9VIBR|nr:DUF393 domain-containing protein [Vibrio qingdaonensis]MCW8347111.1 DUF393 domain-containing protein [Vibrio qingdaonensis]